MKVLIVGQLPVEVGGSYTTGVCNVVYELSKCASADVNIVVYATNMNDSNSSRKDYFCYRGTKLNPFLSLIHFIFHPYNTITEWLFYLNKCHASPIRYDAYRYNVERIIREEKPDVIHCMSVCQMASCYYANRESHLPLILTSHGIDANPQNEFLSVLGFADIVTGLTPEIIQWLSSHGAPNHKLIMVPNGTDVSKFYFSETEREIVRKEMGISNNTTVLLTIGALCYRKGQLSFLSKLRELPNEFDYVYIIIGKGEDEEKIKLFVEENKMQNHVRILGYINNTELYRYHSAADVYVHCSRAEGQALSEVEAYASDLKIALNRDVEGTVITDTSNINDYWKFDFESFDRKAFVRWASVHKDKRTTRKMYDWSRIFELYCGIYQKLICNHDQIRCKNLTHNGFPSLPLNRGKMPW